MKKQKPLLLFFFFCVLLSSRAQQPFQNLDFESANLTGYSPGSYVPINMALPGWTGYYSSSNGTIQATQVAYEGLSLGGASISIVDSNAYPPLQGNYSVFLFGGGANPLFGGESGVLYSPTISQTGSVPDGTLSLQVMMRWQDVTPLVALNGQTITMVPLETFPNYTLYGGNISSFAGQTVALSISEPLSSGVSFSMLELDNIVFSSQPIPEPSIFGLLALGGLLLRVRRRLAGLSVWRC